MKNGSIPLHQRAMTNPKSLSGDISNQSVLIEPTTLRYHFAQHSSSTLHIHAFFYKKHKYKKQRAIFLKTLRNI